MLRDRGETKRSAMNNHPIFEIIDGQQRVTDEIYEYITRYEDNKSFTEKLNNPVYRRVASKDLRYLFYEYETDLQELSKEELTLRLEDIVSGNYHIEHVWAQTPSGGVPDELIEIYEELVDVLGNLAILAGRINPAESNKPYIAKRPTYRKSSLKLLYEITNNDQWGEEEIRGRQRKLVQFILNHWRIHDV